MWKATWRKTQPHMESLWWRPRRCKASWPHRGMTMLPMACSLFNCNSDASFHNHVCNGIHPLGFHGSRQRLSTSVADISWRSCNATNWKLESSIQPQINHNNQINTVLHQSSWSCTIFHCQQKSPFPKDLESYRPELKSELGGRQCTKLDLGGQPGCQPSSLWPWTMSRRSPELQTPSCKFMS